MDRTKLLELLAEDKLEELFKALELICAERWDLQQDWISLSGRFHQLQRQDLRGVRDLKELETSRNQLREDLATFIDICTTPAAKIPTRLLKHFFWPLSIFGISALVIGIGTLPIKMVSFEAILRTRDLTIQLAAPWPEKLVWNSDSFLGLSPLKEVEGTSWRYDSNTVGGPIGLVVGSGNIKIGPLYIPKNEPINLSIRGTDMSLLFEHEGIRGELGIQNGNLIVKPNLKKQSYGSHASNGELITWKTEPSAQLEFSISAADTARFREHPIQVKSIAFSKKELEDTARSTILSGTVTIIESGEKIVLKAKENLEIGQLEDARFFLKPMNDQFEIVLSGKTNSIKTGYGHKKSLKPSLLVYLYRDRTVYFLGSLFISMVSLLWTLLIAMRKFNEGK